MNNTIQQTQISYNGNTKNLFNSIVTKKVLQDLQDRGFIYLFKLREDCICCKAYNIAIEDFDIVEVHSFATTDLSEGYNIYAIRCDKYNVKGVLINVDSTYANLFSNICINKVLSNDEFDYKRYENYQNKIDLIK